MTAHKLLLVFRWLSGSQGSPGWPATLGPLRTRTGTVTLRPVKVRDARTWSELRIRNQNALLPWEPTGVGSWAERHQPGSWPPLFAVVTTAASCGAVNSMHDSFTALGGMIPLFNMLLGEIIYGGVGAGFYEATPARLAEIRKSIDHDRSGPKLESLLRRLTGDGWEIAGDRLKTAPRGYDVAHPRIELLRHRSLSVGRDYGFDEIIHSAELVDRVRRDWRATVPFVEWIAARTGS